MIKKFWLSSMAIPLAIFGMSTQALGDELPRTKEGLLQAAPGDWPWWRGPTLDGKSTDRDVVTKWTTKDNVVWGTKVPGRGLSSPIVMGNRIFMTTAEDDTQKQSVLAFDRATGKPLWNTLAHQGNFMRKYPKNSHASATPACDGEKVFSVFINQGGLHVTATDLAGKILWQVKAGDFQSEHGYGSSPVLYKSLVIVNGDNLKGCYLAALDVQSGKVVWRTDRKTTGRHGSYGTPLLAVFGGKAQLVLAGMGETAAYDPDTGNLLWSCTGPAEVTGNTVVCNKTMIFSSGGFPEKEIRAIRTDGSGDVTKSHVAWSANKGVAYVPSPLYHDGLLYVVSDGGLATCFEAETGKQIWQDRVEGAYSSSPVLVGDKLYITSEAGLTSIIKTGRKFELAGTNSLKEGVLATPAVCGGRIYLRTERHLYCLGSGEKKQGARQ